MTSTPYRFDPRSIFAALNDAGVRYVVIGGVAATLHGSTLRTGDADICPASDRENLDRLAPALRRLDAHLRTDRDAVPVPLSPELLATTALWNFTTSYGDLDVAFRPAGTSGYDDLRKDAVAYELDGVRVKVASLSDVIRSKTAAGRAKDQRDVPFLQALLEERGET